MREADQQQRLEQEQEQEQEIELLQKDKVRELEQQCWEQSQQFRLLSRGLEQFWQHAGHVHQPGGPLVPGKSLPPLMNGLAASLGRGPESTVASRTGIRDFLRPLEPLSLKPSCLPRPTSPGCRSEADMDGERSASPSKQRYSGKVRLCVARYSYNPFDGPNENPEAELPLAAGKYLYVYGDMDEDGFYEGELLDGQRGLVPSNFVDFAQDPESRPAGTPGGGGQDPGPEPTLPGPPSPPPPEPDAAPDSEPAEDGEDSVPYPRGITLIKQLAKSAIVGWEAPALPPGTSLSGYVVLVDQEPRLSLAPGGRPKALLEKLDVAARTHRVSVQCLSSRGASDPMRCTLQVGRDVAVAPSQLRVDRVTPSSALLLWQPADSNYRHAVFLGEQELGEARAAQYTFALRELRPGTAYHVRLLARPHHTPWQLPLEQRERREAGLDFRTLPTGPPDPPRDIMVLAGPTPSNVLVSWKPPTLTATGLSNGAAVTGYGVYAKDQRVAELLEPTGSSVTVELPHLRSLEATALTVRTLWAGGESEDASAAVILPHLLAPPATPAEPRADVWEPGRAAATLGRTLEPPDPGPGRRSPSPSRILPQPQGAPVSSSVAKAMAREAAQRVADSSRLEKRSVFLERGSGHYVNSDEEDACESPDVQRRAVSVDDFLKGSELGKQHCCHGDEYHTESSRGSDLSDIMEEDEEELYSEMQLEDGRRRPSGTSHNALKDGTTPQGPRSPRLCSIPEVAKEDGEPWRGRAGGPSRAHAPRPAQPHWGDTPPEERGCRLCRWATRSPDSGLDCGSEEEELHLSLRPPAAPRGPGPRCACPGSGPGLLGPPRPPPGRGPLRRQDGILEDAVRPEARGGRLQQPREAPRSPAGPPILGNPASTGRADRADGGHRLSHGMGPPRPRAAMVPAIDDYGQDRLSPEPYEESETDPGADDLPARVFVALFDYDPLTMSPNPDAAEEELPFKEGQIIKVYGDKDADGFYRGETCARLGLIPCNMVSEIRAEDEEMVAQLLRQGFLPLSTPVEKTERSRRTGRRPSPSTRRMVALYDYDPRESSPNVDVEAELTFCTGDIITVFGDIDEDGFYYGELNGQKGLVPSNFLEEVPDDVQVYLSDAPMRPKAKRVSLGPGLPQPLSHRGDTVLALMLVPWPASTHPESFSAPPWGCAQAPLTLCPECKPPPLPRLPSRGPPRPPRLTSRAGGRLVTCPPRLFVLFCFLGFFFALLTQRPPSQQLNY
ncbi:RIMS-binding protein 2 isoform X3 [Erinaceus europaeus]|uniref:RIMS-binding protein 2 isoform X3 n=1 Tax=Erinaceus europaeus TaxID=9365 RepID=A0ABM3XIT2_ERIEU|nr:RIMS-binding protein 2 isoform X3 [Erinaceus europaeus]